MSGVFAMSFDLHLERLEFGKSAQVDRACVLSLLRRHCQNSADRFGYYELKFPDGSHVELQAKGLESDDSFTGCGFHLRGFSPAILTFVFDLAVAGDMVIFNAQGIEDSLEKPLVILVNQLQKIHLPEGMGHHPVLCTSPRQLTQLLGLSFEQWSEFRDAAIGQGNAS
jgi:hypothetical protein